MTTSYYQQQTPEDRDYLIAVLCNILKDMGVRNPVGLAGLVRNPFVAAVRIAPHVSGADPSEAELVTLLFKVHGQHPDEFYSVEHRLQVLRDKAERRFTALQTDHSLLRANETASDR